jgi:hypothetical protein
MAAETEFWRAKRQVAGVLVFCGLGYSKPTASTSDNFVDVRKLVLDPYFAKYVRDAFAPVGLMIDFWDEQLPAGQSYSLPVVVVNDLDQPWRGSVRLSVLRGQTPVLAQEQDCHVARLGVQTLTFNFAVPSEPGHYQLVAQLYCAREEAADVRSPAFRRNAAGKPPKGGTTNGSFLAAGQPLVESWRDFAVVPEEERIVEVARGKPATASSSVAVAGVPRPASNAVDGKAWTRWSSEPSDPQWLAVDLERPTRISRVQLVWEGISNAAYAKKYRIQVSDDGAHWKDVFRTDSGKGGIETIRFAPVETRYVRLFATERGGANAAGGYVLFEFRVFR